MFWYPQLTEDKSVIKTATLSLPHHTSPYADAAGGVVGCGGQESVIDNTMPIDQDCNEEAMHIEEHEAHKDIEVSSPSKKLNEYVNLHFFKNRKGNIARATSTYEKRIHICHDFYSHASVRPYFLNLNTIRPSAISRSLFVRISII